MDSVGNFGIVDFGKNKAVQDHLTPNNDKARDSGFPFRIIDEMRDIRILLSQLDNEYASKHFYTKDEMREIISHYTLLKDFRSERENEYSYVLRNGWQDLLEVLQRSKNAYTKEECITIARLYNTRQELREANRSIHKYIEYHNWQEECYSHMNHCRKPITREECVKITQEYDNYTTFNKEQPRVARALRNYGWHDELTAHMAKVRENWTVEKLKKLIAKYTSYADFCKNKRCAYQYIHAHNLGYLLDGLEKRESRTLEQCLNIALDYTDKMEFYNKERKVYIYARNKGWLDEICEHMTTGKRKKQWTKKEVLAAAAQCNSFKMFRERLRGAYNIARRRGWIDEVKELCKPRFHWTYETAKEKALQYESYNLFSKEWSGCLDDIRHNGWESLLSHMNRIKKSYDTDELKELASKYATPLDFKRNHPYAFRAAKRRGIV